MGIFEKFRNTIETNELKRKKSHLKNLYQIAMTDGNLANVEFDFLLSIANKMYLQPSVVQNVVSFPDDISFYVPSHDKEKLDQIYDCVCMILIDGDINQREIGVCKLIAIKLGFRPVIVDYIIETIVTDIINGIASEFILQKLLNEL